MTPFQQFRLWARRAPVWERAVTATMALGLVVVLVWAVRPLADPQAATSAATGVLSYRDLAGTGEPPSVAPVPEVAPEKCPGGTDQGADSDSVTLAVAYVDLGGAAGNDTFGLPSPDDQKQAYEAVANSINDHGGAGCRQIELEFYKVNPASQDSIHQQCLNVLQDKPFAVMGIAFETQAQCIAQGQVPFIAPTVTLDDHARYYPYLFGTSIEMGAHNAVLGLEQVGYFDPANGFDKLGVIYSSCNKTAAQRFLDDIESLDLDPVVFDVGGSCGPAPSAALQQAVLKFKSAGVTNVIPYQLTSTFANLTNIADAQKFTPRWGMTPDGTVQITYGLLGPNFDNMEGAVAVMMTSFGEEHSGTQPAPGTVSCNSIMSAAGLPSVYDQLQGIGGIACSQLWQIQVMLNNAPEFSRDQLAEGLQRAGSLPFAYPYGPGEFGHPRVTLNGGYWRVLDFDSGCDCWKLESDEWNPGFP